MLVHTPSKSLLLRLRPDKLAQLRELFPKHSRPIDYQGHNLAVPHNLNMVRVLRNMGIAAPSPIRHYYGWPRPPRFPNVFRHQYDTAEFLTLHARCFVLSDPGTAKTSSTLWAADYLMEQGLVKRVLIVAKLSTLEQVWLNEIFDVCMHRTALVLHADADKRRELLKREVDFYIINHDGLKILSKDIDLVIVDEASAYRNATTDQYKVLEKVAKNKKLWLLTGTPCPNAPTDAWALARLVNPSRVPEYFTQFKKQTMNQISTYKWVPKPGSHEIAYQAMQPAIRFKKSECLDLPPVTYTSRKCELSKEQETAYSQMKNLLVLQAQNTPITAVNAADKISKLRQILCLSYDTMVMTTRGWVQITEVTPFDRVWDGIEWVCQDGPIYKGRAQVIECNGVGMTPDHEVLTTLGWRTAEEAVNGKSSNRLDWAGVRLPDGNSPCGNNHGQFTESIVGVPMYMRSVSRTREPELTLQATAEREALRLSAQIDQCASQDVIQPSLPHLDQYEAPLHQSERQGLEKLWCAGGHGVHRVARFIRCILGGHARRLCRFVDVRSQGQQPGLQQGQLPLGYPQAASQQHTLQSLAKHPEGAAHHEAGSRGVRTTISYAPLPPEGRVGTDGCANSPGPEVYDLLNCGPRNRFVVRGRGGELLIVHNCGAVKQEDGDYLVLDHAPRLKVLLEAIEEASAKVLVIVPFKGIVQVLAKEVQAWHDKRGDNRRVEVVNGDVSPRERGRIFQDFRDDDSLTELICHPKVMAHGLNLTQADMVIFYAPIYSNEEALQVMDRINRPGQTRKMTILRIAANGLEQGIYAMLQNRALTQESILALYKKELGGGS